MIQIPNFLSKTESGYTNAGWKQRRVGAKRPNGDMSNAAEKKGNIMSESVSENPNASGVGSMELLSGGRTYLLVGSGESYGAEIVAGDKLLHRMLVAIYGEGPHDELEVKAWREHLMNEDNWCRDPDYGPTEYHAEVGETDHIRAFLVTAAA